MNKMHSSQLFALLLLSGVWQVICLPSLEGAGQLAGTAGACLLELVLAVPMLVLAARGMTLTSLLPRHRLWAHLSVLFFLVWGALGLSQLWAVMPRPLLPVPGRMTAAVLIVLTCLYTSLTGLQSTARCAPLLLGLLLLSGAVLCIGAWQRVETARLTRQDLGILPGFLRYLTGCGELGAAWALLGEAGERRTSAVLRALAGKGVCCMAVLFLSLTVCGRLGSVSAHPWFTLTALSQPLQGQRADALFILLFVMLCVLHITLQTAVSARLLQRLHPPMRGAAAPSLGIMLLLAVLVPEAFLRTAGILLCLVTAVLLPLGRLLARHRRLLPLLLVPAFLTGCGQESVADRTYTQVIGLSQAGTLTFVQQPFGEPAAPAVYGRSITDALTRAQAGTGGRIFIGHTELLCLDGTCTADAAQELLFRQGLSPACKVLYCPDLSALPDGTAAVHTLRMAERSGLLSRTELSTVLREWQGDAGTALLPMLTQDTPSLVLMDADGRCTPLSPAAARGMYWLRQGEDLTLHLDTAQGAAALRIRHIRLQRTVQPGYTLLYTLTLHAPGTTPAQRHILQRRIQAECLAALREMTAVRADVLGMEDTMNGYYPRAVRLLVHVRR